MLSGQEEEDVRPMKEEPGTAQHQHRRVISPQAGEGALSGKLSCIPPLVLCSSCLHCSCKQLVHCFSPRNARASLGWLHRAVSGWVCPGACCSHCVPAHQQPEAEKSETMGYL